MKAGSFTVGPAALAARSAVMGAFLNVKINAGEVEDKAWMDIILKCASQMQDFSIALETEILAIVAAKV